MASHSCGRWMTRSCDGCRRIFRNALLTGLGGITATAIGWAAMRVGAAALDVAKVQAHIHVTVPKLEKNDARQDMDIELLKTQTAPADAIAAALLRRMDEREKEKELEAARARVRARPKARRDP